MQKPLKENRAPLKRALQRPATAESNHGATLCTKRTNPAEERVETMESNMSDLSPRSKQKRKLTKHIERSFRQTKEPPVTTTDFYRIGKMLGKGAFGKVNLAIHRLT